MSTEAQGEDADVVDAALGGVAREVASLCGVLNASYARLVAIVAASLADESWALGGIRSPQHWLVMRAGMSHSRAHQIITIARRHGDLPSVMDQFGQGQLSLDQVAVIARYAPAHMEASVAELAIHASVPQLRRCLSGYSFDPPAEPGHTQARTTFAAGDSTDTTGDATNDTVTTGDATNDTVTTEEGAARLDDAGTTEGSGTATTEEDASDSGGVGTAPSDEHDGESSERKDSDTQTNHDVDPHTRDSGNAGAEVPPTWNGLALIEDRSQAPAELSMSHDQYGRFTLRFSAPADLGALVEAALKEAKDALFHQRTATSNETSHDSPSPQPATPQPATPRPAEVTWGEAMVEIATRSLGAVTSLNRRDAFRTYVHLDTEGAWLTGRPRLPVHLSEKLTCNGILQPVWHTQGAPVNVGRAQRIVPTRTRRLIEDRDRGCRFPGCATTTHLQCHHLIHWIHGGPTNTPNLASLCTYHHDRHHLGDFTITGNADTPTGLTFTTRNGAPIHPGPTFTTPTKPPTKPPPDSDTPDSVTPDSDTPDSDTPDSPIAHPAYRGPSGESLSLRWVTFGEPPAATSR